MEKKYRITVINGPNLNMLGQRDASVYGSQTLEQINDSLKKEFKDVEFTFLQSNIEGEIVGFIQRADGGAIVLNGGAYSHYSYAIADALETAKPLKIEVHLSNIYAREEFRHTSVISPKVKGSICGFGADSYFLAVTECIRLLSNAEKTKAEKRN